MTKDLLKREEDYKAEISSAKNAIRHILNTPEPFRLIHKKRLIGEMIWRITEGDGLLSEEKRTGYKKHLTYISESVKKRRDVGNYDISDLIHEHVFKKSRLVDKLIANPVGIDEILKNAIACVVTKEEHKILHKLDKTDKEIDGWERYIKARIGVWNERNKEWKIDYKDFVQSDNKN
jgi:hypothetical protein